MVNGVLKFSDHVYVPQDDDLRSQILTKMHNAFYIAHPENVKIYQDLGKTYWWVEMKMAMAEFVSKYMIC